MLYNFTLNNVFEPILNGNIEFYLNSNILEYDEINNIHPDFTYNTITNKYEYKLQVTHATAIQNVKSINTIDFIKFPNYNLGNIILRFRYSTDNINFSSYLDINGTNLELINNVNYLWLIIEITYSLDDEPVNDITLPLSNINIIGDRFIDEIFNASTIQPGDLKIFTAQDTYKVFKTTNYEVFLQSGNLADLEIYFRYTQNQGRNWTDWTKLTPANLQRQQYIKVKFTDFQFGFRNMGTSSISLYDMELIGDFQNVTGNYTGLGRWGLKTQCNPTVTEESPCSCEDEDNTSSSSTGNCAPCSTGYTPWNSCLDNTCNPNNVTNINDVELMTPLIEKQQILNEYAEAKNHWKFDYYYTDPDKKGIDMMLFENQLTNIIMKRQMKVMVPDNQFPSDTISYSGFGLDLILQFEVHILRSTFKNVFGIESRPRKGDYLYLCNTNLIYEVEQVIDKKDIMNATFYWRVILKKYEEKASRKFAKTQDGQDAKNSTDALVKYTTLKDLFSDENAIDISENNQEKNTIVTEPNLNKSQQATDLVKGTYTLYDKFSNKLERSTEQIWNASTTISSNQYAIPMKSKNLKMVEYTYNDNKVDYIHNRAISMWCKFEDYNPLYDHTLFSNYDYTNSLGYKVNLFNGALSITINSDTYSLPVNLSNNIWYCFYIGLNQEKENIEIAVYKRQIENGKTLTNNALLKIHSIENKLTLFNFNHNENIFIGGVDIFNINNNRKKYYQTNIVLWSEPIVKSKRSAILSQAKMKDSHLVLLVDDAKEPMNLPFYGNI